MSRSSRCMRKVALVGAGDKFGVRKASYRDLIWEAGKACFDSAPGAQAARPRGPGGGLGDARAYGLSEPHRVAGRGGPGDPAERAERAHRAHVRLGHRGHPLRLRLHRRRPRRSRDGARRGEAEPALGRRGHPEHGDRGGSGVGGRLRPHRAAVLRAGRPAAHGRSTGRRRSSSRWWASRTTPTRPRTRPPISTRAPRSTRCWARG